LKSFFLSIVLAVLASIVQASESGVIDHVQVLATLLSDSATGFNPESVQIKKATIVQDDVIHSAWVALFKTGVSQSGRGSRQFLAVFEENARATVPDGVGFNPYTLVNFLKVGDEQGRAFESFSAYGEYIILKGSSMGSQKTADLVVRFDRNSIVEVKGP